MGEIGGNPGGSDEPARDHRAQARAYGAKANQERFPPIPCGPCSTAWTDTCGPTCSTTSGVVAAECGFAATVKAVETVIDAGRTIDRAAIATCARRVLEGKGSSGGQNLKHYDKYMEGRA